MKKTVSTLIVLFTSLVLILASCQSDKGTTTSATGSSLKKAASDFLDSALAKKLPVATYGFMAWDNTLPSAKRYQNYLKQQVSRFSLSEMMALTEADSPDMKDFTEISQWLTDEGFFPFYSQTPITERGIVFLELKDDLPIPGAGMYMEVAKGVAMDKKLESFRNKLTEKGVATADLDEKYGTGFSVIPKSSAIPESDEPSNPPVAVHFSSKDQLFVIASSLPLVEQAYDVTENDNENLSAAQRMKNSPEYKKIRAQLASADDFFFGYFDVKKLNERVSSVIPAEAQKELPFELKDLPVTALSLKSGYSEVLTGDVGVVFDDQKLQSQQMLHKALHPVATKTSGLEQAPANSVVFLSFADSVLSSITELAKQNSSQEDLNKNQDVIQTLEKVQGVQFGLLPSDGSAVFPGVFLKVGTESAEASAKTIKAALSDLSQSQGIPASSWQEKDIEGLKTNFILTPLGVGIYLASNDNGVLLGSSEFAIREAARKGTNGKGNSLISELPSSNQSQLTNGNPLLAVYFNSNRMAELIGSVQGSLSMFTGGENAVKTEDLEEIRRLGTSYSVANYNDGLLTLSGITIPATEKSSEKSAG